MQETFGILIGLVVGLATLVSLVRALLGDGHGRRPPPRSHWEELPRRQHEELRELTR